MPKPRIIPKVYRERETQAVHCEGATGADFTLCGFSLDGDQGEIGLTSGPITCADCLAIVDFCRRLAPRNLPRDRR